MPIRARQSATVLPQALGWDRDLRCIRGRCTSAHGFGRTHRAVIHDAMQAHPDVDPLTVRFTDLRQWVIDLPDFEGDPAKSSEGKLEAIQMAWHEEYQDSKS